MKKLLALLLAAVMCLSLVACGKEDTTKSNSVEVSNTTEYAIGEAFGTDSLEIVITELKWITSEELEEYANPDDEYAVIDGQVVMFEGDFMYIDTAKMFPGYTVWGQTGVAKESASDNAFLCVTYSLQNIGKESVGPGMESDGFMGMMSVAYGTIAVIYDDGYTFDFGSDEYSKFMGFTTPLGVLSDPVNEVMMISVPNQVCENTDKPLKLKVTLPCSNGETEEFIVSVR